MLRELFLSPNLWDFGKKNYKTKSKKETLLLLHKKLSSAAPNMSSFGSLSVDLKVFQAQFPRPAFYTFPLRVQLHSSNFTLLLTPGLILLRPLLWSPLKMPTAYLISMLFTGHVTFKMLLFFCSPISVNALSAAQDRPMAISDPFLFLLLPYLTFGNIFFFNAQFFFFWNFYCYSITVVCLFSPSGNIFPSGCRVRNQSIYPLICSLLTQGYMKTIQGTFVPKCHSKFIRMYYTGI